MIDEYIEQLRQLQDPLLDDWTLSCIRNVYEHALQSTSLSHVFGYASYLKRCAKGENKKKVQRIISAIRTNRWGIRDHISELQKEERRRRKSERLSREIKEVYRDIINDAKRKIPEGKRGRSNRSGRGSDYTKRRKKPAPKWTIV